MLHERQRGDLKTARTKVPGPPVCRNGGNTPGVASLQILGDRDVGMVIGNIP